MDWWERAAILQFGGGLSRPEAEPGALRDAIAHWLEPAPLPNPPLMKSQAFANPKGQTGTPSRSQ